MPLFVAFGAGGLGASFGLFTVLHNPHGPYFALLGSLRCIYGPIKLAISIYTGNYFTKICEPRGSTWCSFAINQAQYPQNEPTWPFITEQLGPLAHKTYPAGF